MADLFENQNKTLLIKNIGFVNCEWIIKGVLGNLTWSLLTFNDRTYDSKIYTFKELDYKSVWLNLTIIWQKINTEKYKLMNDSKSYVPSESENEESKVPPQNKRLSK